MEAVQELGFDRECVRIYNDCEVFLHLPEGPDSPEDLLLRRLSSAGPVEFSADTKKLLTNNNSRGIVTLELL